jgi:hypothetical protein
MKRFLKTIIITWLFGAVWILLEWLIDGVITDRLVDNIMLCVFAVIVYGLQKGE